MEENLDRMVEKLDIILGLAWDCNFTLKWIESRGERVGILVAFSSDDVREPEVDEDEPEPEIV